MSEEYLEGYVEFELVCDHCGCTDVVVEYVWEGTEPEFSGELTCPQCGEDRDALYDYD